MLTKYIDNTDKIDNTDNTENEHTKHTINIKGAMVDEKDNKKGNGRVSGKPHPANQPSKKLSTGDIEALGTNVYLYGTKGQSGVYVRTTEAIGDYVGCEYGKAMKTLVSKGKEVPPTEPTAPQPLKTDEQMNADWKKYEKALDRYNKKMDLYEENKSKVFIVIMGQCTPLMRHKVEGHDKFEKMEEDDDVIELLALIKSYSYASADVQYSYWIATLQFRHMGNIVQTEAENIPAFYKRWMTALQVLEAQYGALVPSAIVKREARVDDTAAAEKFMNKACMFLAVVHP